MSHYFQVYDQLDLMSSGLIDAIENAVRTGKFFAVFLWLFGWLNTFIRSI